MQCLRNDNTQEDVVKIQCCSRNLLMFKRKKEKTRKEKREDTLAKWILLYHTNLVITVYNQ